MYVLLELDADINALDLPHEEKGQSALAIVMYRIDAEMVENPGEQTQRGVVHKHRI